ncbi:MAG: hypothetical protein AB7F59_07980 [Bdellovibrionales bacterium]
MKKAFVSTGLMLVLTALVVLMQNCQSEMGVTKKSSKAALNPNQLGALFTYSSQSISTTQATLSLDGTCTTANYPSTRLEWYFNVGQLVSGTLQPGCNKGRFFLNIPVGNYNLSQYSQITVYADIYGIDKNGKQISGAAQSKTRVQVNLVNLGGTTGGSTGGTTGGTTGGSTGGTTGGSTGGTTGGSGPGACASNPALASLCQGIQIPGDYRSVVADLANERPDLIQSCARNANEDPNWNAFTKELVRRLRAQTGDNRWGFNYVRGNVGDVNGDTISYCGGSGCPQEHSPASVVFDVVESCGPGAANRPSWGTAGDAYEGCCNGMAKWTQTPLQ